MKKIFLCSLISLIFTLSVFAQTNDSPAQKAALTELGELNVRVIALFKEGNFDEALKVSLNAWSLAEKNNLAKDPRVLPGLANLAEIYLSKKKETEAIATLQKILEAYGSSSGNNDPAVVKTLERLGTIYFIKKDYGKSEESFLRALTLREKLNGAVSRETAALTVALANIYRARSNYEKAQKFYLRAIEINDQTLSEKEKESREDISNYECFVYHKAFAENDTSQAVVEMKRFNESRKRPNPGSAPIESGIVNGRATNLVMPSYPMNMRGNEGFVMVRVTIDEKGNVIDAKATCGILGFVESVEQAARKSKFSPTVLSGQPVKVTGMIIYNFRR